MAKRSSDERHIIGLEDGETEALPMAEPVVEETVSSVRLVLLKNVRLNIFGPVTGQMYHFAGAGAYVDVDALDAPGLLAKRSKSSCCTGETSSYFEIGG